MNNSCFGGLCAIIMLSVMIAGTVHVTAQTAPAPQLLCIASRGFDAITWEPRLSDYHPNPFLVRITVKNIGEEPADSISVRFLGEEGIILFETDRERKELGIAEPRDSVFTQFLLRPKFRENGDTLTLRFEVRGVDSGTERIDTCSVTVFVPAVVAPHYNLRCESDADTVWYDKYGPEPDPVVFRMTVVNNGSWNGSDIACSINLPPGIHLATGGRRVQSCDSLAMGEMIEFTWELHVLPPQSKATRIICGRLYDVFNNQTTCCDSVVVVPSAATEIDVSCQSPDTIYVDNMTGTYKNNPFRVSLHVRNVDADAVDSLRTTLLIQSSSLFSSGVSVDAEKDTLSSLYHVVFSWHLEALPIAYAQNARICWNLDVPNGETYGCCREVHLQGFTPQGLVSPPLAAEDNLQAFNAPNPFHTSTSITYHVPYSGRVVVTVHDMLGRTVDVLVDKSVESGTHRVRFDPAALLPGIYFYRVRTFHSTLTGRMLLIK